MLKRLIWMIILVLATTFTVVLTATGTGLDIVVPLPTETTAVLPTLPAVVNTPEATAGPLPTEVLPTDVPTAEATPTEAPTLTSTPTSVPTFTPTPLPTFTPTPVPTATSTPLPTAVPFKVQQMTPIYTTNFAHPDAACNWQGVAGQVFDAKDTPILNYIVKITGTYNTSPVNFYAVTGMEIAKAYGPGGYEIVLGNAPAANLDTLTIQVFDKAGNALTDPMKFSTSNQCTQNLVLINFQAK